MINTIYFAMRYLIQTFYFILTVTGAISCCQKVQPYSSALNETAVRTVVNDAIEWQKMNMPTSGREVYNPQYTGWADGVFLSAVAEWTEVDDSRNFRKWLREIGEKYKYEPAPRTMNPANDIAVSMMYADLYLEECRPKYLLDTIADFQSQLKELEGGWNEIIPTIERLDYQMKYFPETDNLNFGVAKNHERWCWCDALYMAAPTYAIMSNITGNEAYREFMNAEYHAVVSSLYSKEDSLFFRDTRFITEKELNGEKIFWGRGNGWAVASLARVLDLLPDDYYDRDFYLDLYKELICRLVELQSEDGYWRTSLLDPVSFPSKEMSATGFCAYALWWGINRGIIGNEYYDNAVRAWDALVSSVQDGGKLGWIQPIGDTPENISADKNEVYGTAALALTGKEVIEYLKRK